MNPRLAENSRGARLASFRAYFELIRLPNVFTAWADVLLGFLATHGSLQPAGIAALMVGTSSMLYIAGMVLNDVYDVEIDRHERPERPLPSGRISMPWAIWLGFGLLIGGVAIGWLVGLLLGRWEPGVVASALGVAVWAYDARLKRSWLGPAGMGSCRMLNVLFGMSGGQVIWHPMLLVVAAGVGLYIVGVTWFARTEAKRSARSMLAGSTVVMGAGIGLMWWFPAWADDRLPATSEPLYALADAERWSWLWGSLGILILWRCIWAVIEPVPWRIQIAVKQCILSLVVIDAVACFGFRGTGWSVVVLVLLLPAMGLGRWIYST